MTRSNSANPIAGRPGIALALAAALVASLLASFALSAKPAQSQTEVVLPPATLTLDVGSTTIGFGAMVVDGVDGEVSTRTITITNNGGTDITIDGDDLTDILGEDFLGTLRNSAGEIVGAGESLILAADESATLDVSFDPSDLGVKEATLDLTGLTDLLSTTTLAFVDQAGNTVEGILLTGTGVDAIDPAAGADCTIVGTNEGEVLTGTGAADVICALGGNDTVDGRAGDDTIRGGSGNDTIVGDTGKDRLFGQGGKDVINARDGARGDFLKGGPGKDRFVKDRGDKVRK